MRNAAAIEIADNKQYLVDSRLAALARELGYDGPEQVVTNLRNCPTEQLRRQVVEALTTNETFFFRDNHPFQILRNDVLPQIMASRGSNRRLRVWSAACSTGQEPYSLAMLLKEALPADGKWTYDIWATDIDTGALDRAKLGHYRQHEVSRGLPAVYLTRYLRRHGAHWEVNPELRNFIQFEQLNLADPWPRKEKFDLIFLRNVLIYFGRNTKSDILQRMSSQLTAQGLLILGAGESAMGIKTGLQRVSLGKSAVYRRAGSASAVA